MESEYIWEDADDPMNLGRFETPSLTFQILSNHTEIRDVHRSLQEFLKPFIDNYPFYFDTPRFELASHQQYTYIYGEHSYSDNINEEWLLVYLLWQFSTEHKDIYVHVWDSLDGELLLVEGYKVLEDWIDLNSGKNRPWIHDGSIVLVLKDENTPLSFDTSCHEVLNGRVDFNETITEYFSNKFAKESRNYYLETIYDFDVHIPKVIMNVLMAEPTLVSRSISFSAEQFERSKKEIISSLQRNRGDENRVSGRVSVPLLSLTEAIKAYEYLKRDEIEISFQNVLELAVIFGYKSVYKSKKNDEEIARSSESCPRDTLIRSLISTARLGAYVNSDTAFLNEVLNYRPKDVEGESKETLDQDEVIEKLEAFFDDEKAGMGGVENASESDCSDNSSIVDLEGAHEQHQEFLAGLKDVLGSDFSDFVDFCVEEESKNQNTAEKRKAKSNVIKNYNDDSDYSSETSIEYGEDQDYQDINDTNPMSILDTLQEDEKFRSFLNENSSNDLSDLMDSMNASSINPGSTFMEQVMKFKK